MIRTLKKSVGFLTRLTINHAITSATKQRPSTDKKAGRCRLRSASAEVDSVRASTASAKSLRRRGGHFSPPRTSPIRLLAGGRLPRRLNEIRLRPGRQQGLQVTADALVDREQRRGARGSVAPRGGRTLPPGPRGCGRGGRSCPRAWHGIPPVTYGPGLWFWA